MKRKWIYLFLDALLVTFVFLVLAWLKPGTRSVILPKYYGWFLLLLLAWVAVSYLLKKYDSHQFSAFRQKIGSILLSNFIIVGLATATMYLFGSYQFSRFLLLGTVIITTIVEITGAAIIYIFKSSAVVEDGNGKPANDIYQDVYNKKLRLPLRKLGRKPSPSEQREIDTVLVDLVHKEEGKEVGVFVDEYVRQSKGLLKVVSTATRFNIDALSHEYGCLVNLHRSNDIQYINKFFESVNEKLPLGGLFIGKAETHKKRKERILKKYFFPLNYLIYISDFILKRIFPKVPGLKKIYFGITRGNNRLLSRAETLGRLYSCGFEVLEEKYIGSYLFFVARKTGKPSFPKSPTYGPVIRLNRVGKDGKMFHVYKMRTMHPFAEYLQAYVHEKSDLQEGGKFKDDFRVSTLGRLMRKVWIDELPMLVNLLKGEMKFVGVRPLSQHYYNLYSAELQQKRIKHKPGLVPPFYKDMPKDLDEIMLSEMRYLEAYEKAPFKTDVVYFFAAFHNIIFKRARSK
jgi:hypothetical protein